MNSSSTIKNKLTPIFTSRKAIYLFLSAIIILFTCNKGMAQSSYTIDSLYTVKQQFKKDEKIEFKVELNNKGKKKPKKVRQVTAFACACNNKDFCYILYRVKDPKKAERYDFLYINHTQNPSKPQCLCKIQYIDFVNGNIQSIPAIKESGSYFIEITGPDFIMYSNVFAVVD